MPVLIGMVGLVIDGGLMLVAYRETQNAADAAALSAAMDLMLGRGSGVARTTAATYVTGSAYNNLAGATVVVNIPPLSGPYQNMDNYAEAIITCPLSTYLIQALPGISRDREVTARAVAGFEPHTVDEGVATFNSTGPGLTTTGNAVLKVNGRVLVNSSVSAGKDGIWATEFDVTGSINDAGRLINYNTGQAFSPAPTSGAMPAPDLFGNLPTPTAANGVLGPQTIPSNGQFQPGIYDHDINLTGNATFAPGIYVLKGASLSISGSGTITGNGVMFYLTGSDYTSSGTPDSTDPVDPFNLSRPTDPGATFGSVSIGGTAVVTLSPISDVNSPFEGMLFYFRRANPNGISIAGNADQNQLTGTIYDKYGTLTLSGQGTYGAQFAVGSATMSGNGNVTLNYIGSNNSGHASQVFLVE